MPRNEVRSRSVRKALRDVSNNHNANNGGVGAGRFSKSVNAKKKPPAKEMDEGCDKLREDDSHSLDRLLLVQSDLSSLLRQIDELVAQAFKLKATSKQGRNEVESFTHVLSDTLATLKPWVPRFQNILSSSSVESENQLGQFFASKTVSTVSEDESSQVNNPEETTMDSLISPSPLVSWRADCHTERGRQLFLLTPLPISKVRSLDQDPSKIPFERTAPNPAIELPSFLTMSGDPNDDLLEDVALNPTPIKPSGPVTADTMSSLESGFVSPPKFPKRDHPMLVVTPCLKMSPPKSCILLEPISEYSHQGNVRVRKSTPFPVGVHSQISEFSSDRSEDLGSKYPELLGIRQAYKSEVGKKGLGVSPDWKFSPPKSCILLEPPDEKSMDNVVIDCHLPIDSHVRSQQQINSKGKDIQGGYHQRTEKSFNGGPISKRSALIESTPLWKEPESTIRTGKHPGENTLKKELWTKFEAASTYGLRLNVSALRGTAQKGFLDMLDEVSCDDGSSTFDGLI